MGKGLERLKDRVNDWLNSKLEILNIGFRMGGRIRSRDVENFVIICFVMFICVVIGYNWGYGKGSTGPTVDEISDRLEYDFINTTKGYVGVMNDELRLRELRNFYWLYYSRGQIELSRSLLESSVRKYCKGE